MAGARRDIRITRFCRGRKRKSSALISNITIFSLNTPTLTIWRSACVYSAEKKPVGVNFEDINSKVRKTLQGMGYGP